MIEAADLQRLVQRLQAENVTSFDCEGPQGLLLRLRFAPPGAADPPGAIDERLQAAMQPANGAAAVLKSPAMGQLCSEHPLGAWPPAEPGQAVTAGQVVAFLRLGELVLPVTSDRDAAIAARIAADGALVGYGDALFELN